MFYPQRPLFKTAVADCLGKPGYSLGQNGVLPKPEFFNGQSAIVAVNVHLGYNQEDSLVMNHALLERGMFRSEHIRSYKAEVENKDSLERKIKPEDYVNFGKLESKIGRVDSLDDDGFPFVGANLQNCDIVFGKCAESGADHSIKLCGGEGKNFAVVSLRQEQPLGTFESKDDIVWGLNPASTTDVLLARGGLEFLDCCCHATLVVR